MFRQSALLQLQLLLIAAVPTENESGNKRNTGASYGINGPNSYSNSLLYDNIPNNPDASPAALIALWVILGILGFALIVYLSCHCYFNRPPETGECDTTSSARTATNQTK